ncbi:Uncharacterised protein [Klebsiella pneumoniae]|nr:Uncharacterised protein [Klebsiella pneumoniae]
MESLISSIWNFDGLINSALIFVTFGLLGVFIWKRAGSAYSLLNRLWEFCLGGKTFHDGKIGNDSNLLIVFYVQIMPDDFVMQLHRF